MSTSSSSSQSLSGVSDIVSPTTSGGRVTRARGRGRGRGRVASQLGGKGKGRGKGRARGSGRGKAPASIETRADDALHILGTRKDRFRNSLEDMPRERMVELLIAAMEHNPSLMLDLYDPLPQQPGGFHPSEGSEVPDWCVCSHCREMPTQAERLCCGRLPEYCVSLLPDFRVLILDESVLALQRLYRRDVLVFDDEEDIRKANRHAGYRQFVLWQHGRLTVGDRRVIPSCCVWRIRDKYPDAFGQYTGFIPSRLV